MGGGDLEGGFDGGEGDLGGGVGDENEDNDGEEGEGGGVVEIERMVVDWVVLGRDEKVMVVFILMEEEKEEGREG